MTFSFMTMMLATPSAFVTQFYKFHLARLKSILALPHQIRSGRAVPLLAGAVVAGSMEVLAEPGPKVEAPGERRVGVVWV